MRPYRNLNDNSSVLAFEIGSDSIKVMFSHGIYTYSYDSTGPVNIGKMKTLALKGKGLNTFIDENIKKGDMNLEVRVPPFGQKEPSTNPNPPDSKW
jgi:hypothetical protein